MNRTSDALTGLVVLTLAAALAVAYSLRRDTTAPVTASVSDGPLGEENDNMAAHQEPADVPAVSDVQSSELGGAHADA